MRLPVLLVVTLCVWSCVSEVRTQDKSYTLRLCGRELLRAVVYTCGGSRWRRLLETTDFGHIKTMILSPSGRTSPSLLGTRSLDPRRGLHKRDVNQYLTFMCCQIGCQKSDLSRLC
ncbi:unnamed protein product [Lota lota]